MFDLFNRKKLEKAEAIIQQQRAVINELRDDLQRANSKPSFGLVAKTHRTPGLEKKIHDAVLAELVPVLSADALFILREAFNEKRSLGPPATITDAASFEANIYRFRLMLPAYGLEREFYLERL